MAYTVLIVEDDSRTRERLAGVIAANAELQLLAAAGNCAEARRALSTQAPDALLLDLSLPDGDGADLIGGALLAHARVLILSVFGRGAKVDAALGAGASAVLLKDSSAGVIGRAIAGLFGESANPSAAPNKRAKQPPQNHEFM